jgi:hypothetical protein
MINLLVFLLGVFVFFLLTVALFLFYAEAIEEEAEYEHRRMPPWVRKIFELLGLEVSPPRDEEPTPPPRT